MYLIKFENFKLYAAMTLILQLIQANNLNFNHQQSLQKDKTNILIYKNLLQKIVAEGNFKTCVIFGRIIRDMNLETILQKDLQKLLIKQENFQNITKCCGFHTKFLVIFYWHQEKPKEFLKHMAEILNFKRSNKLLIIKNASEKAEDLRDVDILFKLSKFYKFPNVLLIFKDFYLTSKIYRYQIYPKFNIEKIKFNNMIKLFPNKMQNLYGTAIRTIPDQVLPRTAAIIDDQGQLQVKGYVMKFLHLLCKYLNANLEFPLNITLGKTLFHQDIYNLTQNDLIDIPACLLTYNLPNSSYIMSNSYEINKWCVIVPIEPPLTYQAYLDKHFNRNFFCYIIFGRFIVSILLVLSTKLWSLKRKRPYSLRITDILINSNVLSGLCAASFRMLPNPSKSLRLLYVSLFISGLVHSILISSRLQAFLTHPYSNRIQKLQDLSFYNLRLLIAYKDYQFMLDYFKYPAEKLSKLFYITPNYEEFARIQTSLNTSYAYPISSPLWFMYDALQTYMNKPIFRLTRLCFPYTGIVAFVLPPNSLFMDSLNCLIARVRDMGLLEYWLKTSYIDLVKMKKIYLQKDRSVIKKSSMLRIGDFYYIWVLMIRSYAVAFGIFLSEILWFRLGGWLNRK